MKKMRVFDINSILKCKFLFHRMPENFRIEQLKLREQIDAPLDEPSDLAEDLSKSTLPVISTDEMFSKLTDSEKELLQSLENGGQYEAGEYYQISNFQKGSSSNKN